MMNAKRKLEVGRDQDITAQFAKSDDECKNKIGSWKGSGYDSQICV